MATVLAPKKPRQIKQKTYAWIEGRWHIGDAQLIGEAIEKIRRENRGMVEPADLVEHARPDKSPIHAVIFSDDDQVAAEKWRLQLARFCINGLEIVEEDGSRIPAFINVRVTEGQGYVSSDDLLTQEDYRASALAAAKSRLSTARKTYAWLNELGTVWAAIDEAIQET